MSEPIGYQIGAQRTIPGDLQDPLANEHFMETAGIEPALCSGRSKHVALEIEIPAIYTADLEELREYRDDFESESDWLLNCIRVSGPVRLRVEVEGEKDSEVIEVWGHIREARLVEPGRGYSGNGQLTDEQLKEHGEHKLLRDEEPAVCFGRVTLMPVARPCSPEGFPLTRDGLLDDGYQQLNCCLDSGHDGPHYDPVARLEWTPRQDREATA